METRWMHKMLLVLCVLAIGLGFLPMEAARAVGPERPIAPSSAIEVFDAAVVRLEDGGVVVKWRTTTPTTGWVVYGASADDLSHVAYDIRGQEIVGTDHSVLVEGVSADAQCFFGIVSDGNIIDTGGQSFAAPDELGESRTLGEAEASEAAGLFRGARKTPVPSGISGLTVAANESGQGYVVKWLTSEPVTGSVEWGTDAGNLDQVAHDVRGQEIADTTHWVLIENAPMDGDWFFTLVSGGVRHDDRGTPFAAHDLASSPETSVNGTSSAEPDAVQPDSASDTPLFTLPSAGLVGWTYLQDGHRGVDIWTGDPRALPVGSSERNPSPCGSEVYAAYAGTVKAIYKSRTNDGYNWVAAGRGDASASIIVLEHRNVPGASTTLYTMYMHLAKDNGSGGGAGTCISNSTWDYLASGQTIPAGFVLGRQGDLRLSGSRITHLHFSMGTSATGESATVDPSGYLGINLRYGTNGVLPYGDGVISSGKTLRGTINAGERDSVYFYASAGAVATIRMNKRDSSLDPYLYLYAPDGSQVAYDDDSGGNYNALIDRASLRQRGVYKIVCKAWSASQTGSYDLGLNLEGGSNSGCLAESPHPYSDNYDHTWTVTNPDSSASATRIHFSRLELETSYDYMYVMDASGNVVNRFTGYYTSGVWSNPVPGRTVRVRLTTDYSVTRWGFCVDRVETTSGGHTPAAPTNLRATAVSPTQIRLDWNDNSNNESGFRIYDGGTQVATPGANATSHTVGGLSPNSYHCYGIRAYNSYGDSLWTGWACATTPRDDPGRLRVVESLSLSTSSARTGQDITARFRVRNVGGQAITMRELAACARRGTDWNGEWADFPHVYNITLQPGGEYTYEQRRSFSATGGYFAEPVVLINSWVGMESANRVWFTITANSYTSGNLAAGKSSWATSQESSSYAPRYGNDGNVGTRWSSQISSSLGSQWYKVDLGSSQTFTRFVVRWEAAYGAHYWVAWCDSNCTNGGTWYGFERWLNSRQDDVIDFGATSHRYVGILMLGRAPRMNNYSFWEFEVYNRSGYSAEESVSISEPALVPTQIPMLPELNGSY